MKSVKYRVRDKAWEKVYIWIKHESKTEVRKQITNYIWDRRIDQTISLIWDQLGDRITPPFRTH